MDSDLDLRVREDGRVAVVRPRGTLTSDTAPLLRRSLVKGLLGLGRVVVDLDVFRLGRASCVRVFPAVLDHCGGWPKARLTLWQPDREMAEALDAHRVPALVPVHDDFLDSLAAFEHRPPTMRVRTRLACDHRAPAIARQLVRECCPTWQVSRARQGVVELVATELVSNAVTHARTASTFTVQRQARGLRVAVCDTGVPVPADILTALRNRDHPLGRGLALVTSLCTAWGVRANPVGKTVWAEVGD